MQFWSYGPFDVRILEDDRYWKRAFWDAVAEYDEDAGAPLKSAIGCYVFVMSRGTVIRPWYVGKTNAIAGFQGEIFTPHKLKHYKEIIGLCASGWKPQMLLFPLATAGNRLSYAYKTDKPLIEWMERTLIGMGLAKNPQLFNTRDTKWLRECVVDGVFGDYKSHQRYEGAIAARKALTNYED